MQKVKKDFNFEAEEITSIQSKVMSLKKGNISRERFEEDMWEFMKGYMFDTEGVVFNGITNVDRLSDYSPPVYVSNIIYANEQGIDDAVCDFLSFIREEIRLAEETQHGPNFDGFMEDWDDLSDGYEYTIQGDKVIITLKV